jgi:hypothetical protein
MDRIDRALQPGSGFRLALFALSIVILVYYLISNAGTRGGALVVLVVGLAGTAREYLLFNRRRKAESLNGRPAG